MYEDNINVFASVTGGSLRITIQTRTPDGKVYGNELCELPLTLTKDGTKTDNISIIISKEGRSKEVKFDNVLED